MKGMVSEYRTKHFFADHGFCSDVRVQKMCTTISRQLQGTRNFSCWNQFLCLAFAQLTYRESLRDIVCCHRSMEKKLYHMGFRGNISRSTLADANETRDWRIYADFAQVLIHIARGLYKDDEFGVELDNTVYALDSTTIDLCLCFPGLGFANKKEPLSCIHCWTCAVIYRHTYK